MPAPPYAYEKITGGGTFLLPAPDVRHVFTLTPVFGKALKRVIVRGDRIQGKNSGLTADVVEPIVITWEVSVENSDFEPDHIRYHESVSLPWQATSFFADAVDVYNIWWSGGARDWGFDQEILAGLVTADVGPVVYVGMTVNTPGDTTNYEGLIQCDMDVMAIYSYRP